MNPILRRFFAFLMVITNLIQYRGTGDRVPVFSDTEPAVKAQIESEDFSMGPYDLVVSLDGDDSADGTLQAPLRTVTEAKARLAACANRSDTVRVWLREGTYPLTEPIVFDARDRGNVTFIAYPGESVSFSGGEALHGGWTQTTVNGVAAWSRKVSAPFHSLYGEKPGTVRLTRFPESGYFRVRAQCTQGAKYTAENTPWPNYMLGEVAFYTQTEDMQDFPSFRNPQDIVARVLHYWKDEMMPVQSYDPQSGILYCTRPCSMSCLQGDRYYFENVFEALNEPGEWYLDTAQNTLYYIPLPGETPENTVLYTALSDRLLTVNGVDGITFSNITFRDSDWHPLTQAELPSAATDPLLGFYEGIEHPQAAFSTPACITVSDARNLCFDACTFLNIGFSGIRFLKNVQDSTVRRCLFQNIGGNAVYISGSTTPGATVTRNIRVEDCHIYQYGRRWFNAIGVLVTHAEQCSIEHNEIHDGFYTAISVGWNWGYADHVTDGNRICDNRIYDIGQGWLSDMGGIYTLGKQPNTVICGNHIHNVAADEGEGGYGGWGIYLDEGSSGILVEKNLVYDCGSQGFHQHYGKENHIRNNIFAMNRKGQLRITRTEAHISCIFERNIIVGNDSTIMNSVDKKSCKWLESGNFYWDYTRGAFVRSTRYGESDARVVIGSYGRVVMRRLGHYTDAVFADPWFKDAESFDFTLADNSPAVKAGFERWNYSAAGTRFVVASL